MSKTAWGVIVGVLVIFAIIGGTYGALQILCTETDSITRLETAKAVAHELTTKVAEEVTELAGYTKRGFRDIQLSRYQDELRKLGRVYGTTDCDRIPSAADADYCRWLKQEIQKLRAG